jgi:GNAT superfamily N-acetyltransferase
MNAFDFEIVPYQKRYEPELRQLEIGSPQGKWIRFELIKDRFLSRAAVFGQYAGYLAIAHGDRVIGASASSIVDIGVNGRSLTVGHVFDVKVSPRFRNRGIAKAMLRHIRDHFFYPNGVTDLIATTSAANNIMTRNGLWGGPIYQYAFVYLTVPACRRLVHFSKGTTPPRLQIHLGGDKQQLSEYVERYTGHLGLWKTFATYRMKLNKVHPLLRWGAIARNVLRLDRKPVPDSGDVLSFGTLFDLSSTNLTMTNEALSDLEDMNADFLWVCCTHRDWVYRLIKPLAIQTQPYLLLATFPLKLSDRLSIDVRCL